MAQGDYHVLLCARSPEKGEIAVARLQSHGFPGTCELVQLDQTNDNSIAAAVKHVEARHSHLDASILNAGRFSGIATRENMIKDFDTNASSVYFLTHAFRPLLQKAPATARVISVSSGMGSIGIKNDHSNQIASIYALPYCVSKAALNLVIGQLAYDFKEDKNIKFFTVCPGLTVSSLGDINKLENGAKPTDEAVRPLMKIVNGERDAEERCFLHAGGQYPW